MIKGDTIIHQFITMNDYPDSITISNIKLQKFLKKYYPKEFSTRSTLGFKLFCGYCLKNAIKNPPVGYTTHDTSGKKIRVKFKKVEGF